MEPSRLSSPQNFTCLIQTFHTLYWHKIVTNNYVWTKRHFEISRYFFLIVHNAAMLPGCVSGGRFKNIYELLNLRALKFLPVNKFYIFQCTGEICCMEFQRYPLKFHTKYLTHTLKDMYLSYKADTHDDVMKWKHFPRYWPFVRGIHRSPVNSPHKGQRRGTLMFSLICVWINVWVNTREADDLRRYGAHYDVIVMGDGDDLLRPHCSKVDLDFHQLSISNNTAMNLSSRLKY